MRQARILGWSLRGYILDDSVDDAWIVQLVALICGHQMLSTLANVTDLE